MARNFDIYLRDHLTECDLIVYSIPYRDGLSASNRLILEAALNSYTLQKFTAAQTDSKLESHIEQMIKLCKEKLGLTTEVDVSAQFKMQANPHLEDLATQADASVRQVLARLLNKFESGVALTVQPLVAQASLSSGVGNFPISLDAVVSGSLKTDFIRLDTGVYAKADVKGTNKKDLIRADAAVGLNQSVKELCYRISADASASVEVVALLLGTEIHHSLGVWYNGLGVGADVSKTQAKKSFAASAITELIQEAAGTLTQFIAPEDTVVVAASSVDAGLKRYRMLSEMDDLELAALDDSTLEELDYVQLT